MSVLLEQITALVDGEVSATALEKVVQLVLEERMSPGSFIERLDVTTDEESTNFKDFGGKHMMNGQRAVDVVHSADARPEDILPLRRHAYGERALLVEVLWEAVDCLYSGCKNTRAHRLAFEATEWIQNDWQGPFSFQWICQHLDLECGRIRKGLEPFFMYHAPVMVKKRTERKKSTERKIPVKQRKLISRERVMRNIRWVA